MNRVKRKSFNPSEFSSSNYSSNYDYDDSEEDNNISKSDSSAYKVDIKKFEKLCDKFREIPDKRIDSLVGEDKEDFNLIVSYVQLLHDTEYYKYLYEKVENKFKDLKCVQPGTIGGYFAGCIVNDNYHGQATCSVTCAGALPQPMDYQNDISCDKAVIWAEYVKSNKSNKFNFNVLKQAENDEQLDPVLFYVTSEKHSFKNVHDFPGLSKSEKDILVKLGAKRIHIFSYTKDCKYIDLYGRPIDLKDVKSRSSSPVNNSNHGNLGILIIIILIILLILFFGWRFWKKNY